MSLASPLIAILSSVAVLIPVLLVWIVGFALALMRFGQHPRVSGLLAGGIAIVAIMSVLSAITSAGLPMFIYRTDLPLAAVGAIMTTVGIITTLVNALGWGLVVAAALSGRGDDAAPR